jgi:hypothetical protein
MLPRASDESSIRRLCAIFMPKGTYKVAVQNVFSIQKYWNVSTCEKICRGCTTAGTALLMNLSNFDIACICIYYTVGASLRKRVLHS